MIERLKSIVEKRYPIYTWTNPNPENGKPSCRLEIQYITAARNARLNKLIKQLETVTDKEQKITEWENESE